jgi:hypothetical protein
VQSEGNESQRGGAVRDVTEFELLVTFAPSQIRNFSKFGLFFNFLH